MLARRRKQAAKQPTVITLRLPATALTVPPFVRLHRRATLAELARKRPEDIVGSPEWIAENRRLSRMLNAGQS